jgi:hypothetical protein
MQQDVAQFKLTSVLFRKILLHETKSEQIKDHIELLG